jgi:hypothetical protein
MRAARGQWGWHELRSNGEIVLAIRIDEGYWSAFGMRAEAFPMDDELDLERSICVRDDRGHPQRYLEKLQLARAHEFGLSIGQIEVGTDGDPHCAVREYASPERV